jgi:hypothetical protein
MGANHSRLGQSSGGPNQRIIRIHALVVVDEAVGQPAYIEFISTGQSKDDVRALNRAINSFLATNTPLEIRLRHKFGFIDWSLLAFVSDSSIHTLGLVPVLMCPGLCAYI